jgi:VanZ family protein
MNRRLKYQGLTILWALFVFIMCTIKLGKVEGSPLFFPGFDKLVHCGFFLVFTVFYSFGIIRQHNYILFPFKYALLIFILAVAYGGTLELLQAYVFTWRDGNWDDLFADTVGAAMGVFSVLITSMGINYGKK